MEIFMEDNGNFEKGPDNGFSQQNFEKKPDDGFTQSGTYQDTQQNLARMHSQSTEGASGFAIAGMVCGILSIVCCCAWYISIILSILGLVFSIMVLVRKLPGRSLAIAGVICASIGLVLAIVILISVICFNRGLSSMSPAEWRSLIESIESME